MRNKKKTKFDEGIKIAECVKRVKRWKTIEDESIVLKKKSIED